MISGLAYKSHFSRLIFSPHESFPLVKKKNQKQKQNNPELKWHLCYFIISSKSFRTRSGEQTGVVPSLFLFVNNKNDVDKWGSRQMYLGTSLRQKCQIHLKSEGSTKLWKLCLKIQWQKHVLARIQGLEGENTNKNISTGICDGWKYTKFRIWKNSNKN